MGMEATAHAGLAMCWVLLSVMVFMAYEEIACISGSGCFPRAEYAHAILERFCPSASAACTCEPRCNTPTIGWSINSRVAIDHAVFDSDCTLKCAMLVLAAEDIACNSGSLFNFSVAKAQAVFARS